LTILVPTWNLKSTTLNLEGKLTADDADDTEVKEKSRALVLEGGGMRGAFTAGVLEAFAEELGDDGSGFDAVVACSAGACNAASYLAGQPRRNRRVYLDFLDGGKLVRWSRLLTGGSIMDIDYLMDDVTIELCPLDLERLKESQVPLFIGVMDADNGETRYLTNHQDDVVTALRATCALPAFYRGSVVYQGRRYLDGGVSDPVPVRKAIELGAGELVVVLTSSVEARTRKKRHIPGLLRWMSSDPAVRKALEERHLRYREAAELLSAPPRGVTVHVVRPSRPLGVGRTTRSRRKLESACDLGYEDGRKFLKGWTKTTFP
jgi:predicted patatin/cPLA2 family phospholipase